MRAFLDELLSAMRGLARAPAFAALAVGVLGLGLGAVIFMYGMADTLMLKPAPYPDSERIYRVVGREVHGDGFQDAIPPQDYELLRAAQTQFEAFGSIYVGTVYLTGDGRAERYDGGFADGTLFDVAGTAPELGRAINGRDTIPGAAPVAVLGNRLWRERFAADPEVIGRAVRVNGRTAEVVGVMPKGFSFPTNVSLWLADQQDAARLSRIKSVPVEVFGRLRVDGDPDLAQQEFAAVAARIKAQDPQQIWDSYFEVVPLAASFIGDDGARLVWALLVAVSFVLLIACANVSNLLLARSAYRVRETTIRSALGATRGRLVMHMLAEGLAISTVATLLGLLLAAIALDGMRIVGARVMEGSPSWWTFEIDARVVAAAVAAALLATLVAGLPAALRATRPSLDALLRDGGRTGTALAIGRITWALVVVEVALACAVLGGAALMTKNVLAMTSADVGVGTAEIMTARVGLTIGTYPEDGQVSRFWQDLLQRIEAQPGIDAAAVTTSLPQHGSKVTPVSIEGRDYGGAATRPQVQGVLVSPSFFDTFRLGVREGRSLDSRDRADTMPVVVINEAMARQIWPDQSPVGARLRFELDPDSKWRTVVGVVPDIVHGRDGVRPTVYSSLVQTPERFMSIAVRGDGDPRALIPAVRTALAQTDPDLALYWVRTLDEAMVVQTAGDRIIGTIFAVFAVVALVLAAAGLFGVLAFHVGQRTREIGLRRALGADDGRILKLVMRASGSQVLVGIALGMAFLPFIGRGLGRVLRNSSPYDPAIYGLVLAIMLVVAVAAMLTPTRRALRVDPAVALRYE
jgi:predicted permease